MVQETLRTLEYRWGQKGSWGSASPYRVEGKYAGSVQQAEQLALMGIRYLSLASSQFGQLGFT